MFTESPGHGCLEKTHETTLCMLKRPLNFTNSVWNKKNQLNLLKEFQTQQSTNRWKQSEVRAQKQHSAKGKVERELSDLDKDSQDRRPQ